MTLQSTQVETLEPTPASVREYAQADARHAGNREHDESIYRAHHRAVYRFLCNRIGDAHAAEDLAAEVFLTAIRKHPETRGALVRAWLLRVASYKASHWIRSNKRRLRREAIAARASSDHEAAGGGAEGIQRALLRLSARHQHVLALFYFGDLSVQQIAAVERCSPGTVKSRLSRARQAMRAALQEEVKSP